MLFGENDQLKSKLPEHIAFYIAVGWSSFSFITTINLQTLLLYHLHVSLRLQLIKKHLYDKYYRAFLWRFMALRPRILMQKKKPSIKMKHFIGKTKA